METNHRTFDAASVNGIKTDVRLVLLPALQGCVRVCASFRTCHSDMIGSARCEFRFNFTSKCIFHPKNSLFIAAAKD